QSAGGGAAGALAVSLHDALPISGAHREAVPDLADGDARHHRPPARRERDGEHHAPARLRPTTTASHVPFAHGGRLYHVRSALPRDRKSTRLNSSHDQSSYAVFCL